MHVRCIHCVPVCRVDWGISLPKPPVSPPSQSLSPLLAPPASQPTGMDLPLDMLSSGQHETPHANSRYVNYKYRMWFTWCIMQQAFPTRWLLNVLSGEEGNRDLWLWEDEDEEYIKPLAEDLSADFYLEIPRVYWVNFCPILEARPSRTTTSPLGHLTPQTRLRFIAWLIIAGFESFRVEKISRKRGFGKLHASIACWGKLMSIQGSDVETCETCGISHLLNVWLETMLEVYLLDDLQAIRSYHACVCLERHLTAIAHSKRHYFKSTPRLERDSAVLRVLYDLVVSPWPLILHPCWPR
ncbi:hypothetical protein B0H13DRAFT_993884 [Mycena leptocephala]|nr:hypothetical protein B0H13DRAFT_993884 [Mycena leptocephala]